MRLNVFHEFDLVKWLSQSKPARVGLSDSLAKCVEHFEASLTSMSERCVHLPFL